MSPPVITPHANANDLLSAFLEDVSSNPRRLEPVRVVVPSVHLRDWLQIQIARRLGICMGFEFSTPKTFVEEVFLAAGIPKAAHWSKARLAWAIHETNLLIPGANPKSPRDRFALAQTLADRFDQYAHFRPAMIEAWAGEEHFLQNIPDETWQRELWSCLRRRFGDDPGLLPGRLEPKADLATAFQNVQIIGSGSLDPLLVEVLGKLAECGCGISAHIVLPCLGYLGDLKKNAHAVSADAEPGAFDDDSAQNPLLSSMARHAAGAFVLLGKLDDQYTNWPDQPSGPHPETILGLLQHGIRHNEAYENIAASADSSLSVHECYGPRRELEVLRDEILRAYRDIPGLKPEEILIAAPSIDDYAPLVPAVFQSGEIPLPVRLTELPPGESDAVCEGLLALLRIAHGGRGRASEVLDLLQLRAVRTGLQLEDDEEKLEFLSDLLRHSGLTQGLKTSDPAKPGDWRFSLDRLIAGEFFGPNEPDPQAETDFQLPVADRMGSNLPLVEKFNAWLAHLHTALQTWKNQATPHEWAGRLESAANHLLGGEESDMADAARHIAFLRDLEMTSPIDSAVVLDWLGPEVEESNRRTPACGATLFGRLKQLHNTPCRMLALVGMQNDNFPAQTATPSWDLLRAKPKIWDRNARVDDRQMFLDSILAPSDRLIITASTLNIRTNKSQPLSTCVEELLSASSTLGAPRETLVRKHPLQPFSVKYFSAGENPGQLSKPIGSSAARLAERLHSADRTPAPLHVPSENPPAGESRTDISLAELVAFWKDPAKAFLKAQRIAVPFDEADDKDLDLAPLSLDSLESWSIKDAILRERLSASGKLNLLKNRLRADRALPPGEFGEKIWEAHRAAAEPIAETLAGILGESLPLELEIDSCRIHGEVLLHRDKTALVFFRAGEIKNPSHLLAPWIMANFAAAAGHSQQTLLLDETLADPPVRKPAISQDAARAAIETLVHGFLEGRQRPLCYAPKTSKRIPPAIDEERADLDNAKKEWSKEDLGYGGGEGLKESSRLAWRDCDPFEDGTDWERWGKTVAQPLEQW